MIIGIALYLLAYVQTVLITIASGEFITVRDPDFQGPDKRLNSLLAQRIAPPMDLTAVLRTNATVFLPDIGLNHIDHHNSSQTANVSQFFKSGRRQLEISYRIDYDIEMKILDMMRQSIYQTRDKFKILQRIVKKFQKDERYRIAYIFASIDQWQKEMHGIYQTSVHNEIDYSLERHIYYYEQLLRRQVDVTYSLQFLYKLHHHFLQSYQKYTQSISKS